jgi:hypothetical protein
MQNIGLIVSPDLHEDENLGFYPHVDEDIDGRPNAALCQLMVVHAQPHCNRDGVGSLSAQAFLAKPWRLLSWIRPTTDVQTDQRILP